MLSVYKNGIIAVMFTLRKIGKLLFRCAIHVLFWIVVYFFYNYFLGYGSENTEYVTRFSLFLMPATVVVSYVFLLKGLKDKDYIFNYISSSSKMI